ncbi:MAG: hypothetical protein PSV35_02090, partial [bacterium]|nr:hypothetical protein [bacterium]
MQKIIEDLIKAIIMIPPPISPQTIIDSFSNYPDFKITSPTTDVEDIYEQLVVLEKLAHLTQQLTYEVDSINLRQTNVHDLNTQKIRLQEQISILDSDLITTENELTQLYQNIIQDLESNSLINNHLSIVPYNPTLSLTMQKNIIVQHVKAISPMLKQLELPTLKQRLKVVEQQGNDLCVDLIQRNETYTKNHHIREWHTSHKALITTNKLFKKSAPDLDFLCKQFSQQLGSQEIQFKLMEIDQQKRQLEEDIKSAQKALAHLPLSPQIKTQVYDELQQSGSTQQVIAHYQAKLDTLLTVVNPVAWLNWYQNPDYNLQQAEFKQIVAFLQFHEKIRFLKLKQEIFTGQKLQLDELTLVSRESNELMMKKLTAQSIALINKLPTCTLPFQLTTHSPPIDFYLTLIANIPFINNMIIRLEQESLQIEELISVLQERELLEIEVDTLSTNNMPSNEMWQSAEYLTEKQTVKQALINQQQLGEQYLTLTNKYSQLDELHYKISTQIKIITNQVDTLDAPFTQQINAITAQIHLLQKDLLEKIHIILNMHLSY